MSQKLFINTLCEFGPIIAFIVLFEIRDFMSGVIAMMIATVISLFVLYKIEKRIPIFALISSGSVLIFGGITLLIDVPSMFILRDTIFDAVFGCVLIASVWYGKPLFKYIFSGVFLITDTGWSTLSLRWGIFSLSLLVQMNGLGKCFLQKTGSMQKLLSSSLPLFLVSISLN